MANPGFWYNGFLPARKLWYGFSLARKDPSPGPFSKTPVSNKRRYTDHQATVRAIHEAREAALGADAYAYPEEVGVEAPDFARSAGSVGAARLGLSGGSDRGEAGTREAEIAGAAGVGGGQSAPCDSWSHVLQQFGGGGIYK